MSGNGRFPPVRLAARKLPVGFEERPARRSCLDVASWWIADVARRHTMRQHVRMKLCQVFLVLLLAPLANGCDQAPTTYAASCSIPPTHWGREKDGVGHMRVVQPVYIGSDGSILWNKAIISDATLRSYMFQMSTMNPEPQAVLVVSPAAECKRVGAVRSIMDASPMCKGPHSLCSEGWNWRAWPELGEP